jgi:glycosyltransferase involved in cell wall biosynthesis
VTVPYGNVIATEHFVPPESRGTPPRDFPTSSEPVAIVVGRLIEVKRPFEILDATARICEQLPQAKVLMIGDGPLKEPLMKACRERELDGNILFLGSRDQEWLVRAYPNCTAYLSPLTGRALAEAALAGVPAIAYDCDWHSELVKTDKTGTLVSVGDSEAMANAFVDLVKHPEKRKELGRNARSLALEMMAPDRLLRRERAAFSRLLETWSSP